MASSQSFLGIGGGTIVSTDEFLAHSKDLGLEKGMLCADPDCPICMEYAIRLISDRAAHDYKVINNEDARRLARQHHPFIPA